MLEHLDAALNALQTFWGSREFQRLGGSAPASWDEQARRGLQAALGEEAFLQIQDKPLSQVPEDLREAVIRELGRQVITNIYRELLLRIISNEWIEYITQMEGLRVSIGLEAYAQRDPLVQYKSRASEMFSELLRNIRRGMITRMFTFRPSKDSTQTGAPRGGEASAPQAEESAAENKPRKRRRRRRKR